MTALYAMGEVAALMQATCRGLARLFDLTETLCTSSDASTLLATITGAVERFERLANEKPELFRPVTRGRMAIPAMVSQNKEKMEAAQALAKNLHTGEAYHLAILPTGNKGRHWQFKDPANALAARLVEEIEFTRVWSGWYRENAWWEDAVKLEPFSEHTWRSWAKFAWRILDNGNHPMLHDPRTKICNVRTQRTEEDFSKSAKWNAPRKIRQSPSIAAEDIREALFGAFELIATGISQRTKRRRKASPDK